MAVMETPTQISVVMLRRTETWFDRSLSPVQQGSIKPETHGVSSCSYMQHNIGTSIIVLP